MSRRLSFSFALCCSLIPGVMTARAAEQPPPRLLIDDFESGVDRWTHDDAGELEQGTEPSGNKYLRWTAGDNGLGHVALKRLTRETIDFSRYDILRFRYRVEGKPLYCLNPIIQQYPFLCGYRGLYYAVDSMDIELDAWRTYTLDLRMVENAWPDTFSTEKQEFQFELQQLAGAGHTVVSLDDIELVRNTLGVRRSYAGAWHREANGDQITEFAMPVRNTGLVAETVRLTVPSPDPDVYVVEVPTPERTIAPGTTTVFMTSVRVPVAAAAKCRPWDGVTLSAEFATEGQPGLKLATLLPCGIKPARIERPQLLCTPDRARELRESLADPERAKQLPGAVKLAARPGDAVLAFEPSYPPCAISADYYKTCPFDGTRLVETPMPNLPEATFQCPSCGRFQRGLFYESAMRDWLGQHNTNADVARQAGVAFVLTGDQAYAKKAARILTGYIDTYLRLPQAAMALYSEIDSSGSARISGTYMHERNWLSNLAVALDCIWDSGVLTDEEKAAIRDKIFVPSATTMMDHRVGAMNLQWMIVAGVVNAGLACEEPALVARGLYSDHGVIPLMAAGYTHEGLWHENPSYQNVQALAAYPLLATLFQAGVLPYTSDMDKRYKAMWLLAAPDGRFPALGTGSTPSLINFVSGVKSIAHLSGDPEIAWIDANAPQAINPFRSFGTKIPSAAQKPIKPGTIVLSDYGVAVLRSRSPADESAATTNPVMYAALDYGRHLVHGHYNKLSVNAWGHGGWFLRNIEGGYGRGFEQFTEATASNSTVMVDGLRQDQDTGELTFQRTVVGVPGVESAIEVASAREQGAWKDVEHERTLVQTADWLLMIDHCSSDKTHVYDWLAHFDSTGLAWDEGAAVKQPVQVTAETDSKGGSGAPRSAIRPRDKVTTLGTAACYQYFLPADEMVIGPRAQILRYTREKGTGLRLSLIDADDSALFRVREARSLIWRKNRQDASFIALFQPYGKSEPPNMTVAPVPLASAANDKPVPARDALAVRLTPPGGQSVLVVVNYSGVQLNGPDGTTLPAADRVLVLPTK